MNVFLGVYEVCGYFKNLEKGLKSLGVSADFISVTGHLFYGEREPQSQLIRFWRHSSKRRSEIPRSKLLKKVVAVVMAGLANLLMVIYVASKYDTLVFGYGLTITNSWLELCLYKLLGKKTIFVYFGSDSRPPYLAGAYCYADIIDYDELAEATRLKKLKIKQVEKYATYIVNHSPQAHLLERNFINFLSIGIPVSVKNRQLVVADSHSKKVRILHCPSHSGRKRSDLITSAIERLKRKGYAIEFVIATDISNDEVLEEISKCDFVVDSLYSDNPLAVFATEAAHYGKPTVVGGYLVDEIARYFPGGEEPPAYYVLPDQIEAGIERLVADEEFRVNLGRRAYEFVNRYWSIDQVAKNYCDIFEDNVPVEWMIDPIEIHYLEGVIPKEKAKEVIGNMIKNKGIESLQISDKPELERAFLNFSNTKKVAS